MNKDLKDIIDSIDSANKAHSDLEAMIKYLKEEVNRLTFTVNEQKQIIQEQSNKLGEIDNSSLPEDLVLLKELVHNQRQEILKKDKDIEILQKTLEDISFDLEKAENFQEENEELIYTKKTVVQLTEENDILKNSMKELQEEISGLNIIIEMKNHEDVDEDQELLDAKEIIFQLTEETGINKVKIESLRLQNEELISLIEEQNDIRVNLTKELEEAEKLVDQLTYDNDNLQEKVNFLQQKLQELAQKTSEEKAIPPESVNVESIQKELRKTEEEVVSLKEIINSNITIIDSLEQKNLSLESNLQKELDQYEQKFTEFTKLISDKEQRLEQQQLEYKKVEDANKQLSDLIVELRITSESVPRTLDTEHKPKSSSIDKIPIPLFFKMYDKLEDDSKNAIVTQLIESLQNGERDLKIYAIKILSILRDKKCLDALINLKSDSDWIIRLYLIKSLANFEPSDIETTLNFLKKDNDTDVREAAAALLSKICQD